MERVCFDEIDLEDYEKCKTIPHIGTYIKVEYTYNKSTDTIDLYFSLFEYTQIRATTSLLNNGTTWTDTDNDLAYLIHPLLESYVHRFDEMRAGRTYADYLREEEERELYEIVHGYFDEECT